MAIATEGWLPLGDAAEQYGVSYDLLRKLVVEGVFTRGRFTTANVRPPIYVKITELDAWRTGGVDAVKELRGPAVAAHDLGESGA